MNPKILFLQQSSLFEQIGGIEYYLDDFIRLSENLFGRNSVYTLSPLRQSSGIQRDYLHELIPYSKNRLIQKFQNRIPSRYFNVALQTIKQFKPTLLFNGHVSLGPLVALLSRMTKIPYVTCVYGIESWGNLWPQDEWALRHSDFILSISEWTKKILVERGYSQEQIKIVYPCLPHYFQNVVPRNRNSEIITLLTVSRLSAQEKYKGHDHVIYALSLLKQSHPSLKLRYVIQGEGSDKARLEKLVQHFKVRDWVNFQPALKDRQDLFKTYQEADIFIMPSQFGIKNNQWRGEGFGIVYAEAASFGLPSIAYDCGGATDIIENGKTGLLVPQGNTHELAKSILTLVENHSLRVQMGNQARLRVREKFSENSVSSQIAAALVSEPITKRAHRSYAAQHSNI